MIPSIRSKLANIYSVIIEKEFLFNCSHGNRIEILNKSTVHQHKMIQLPCVINYVTNERCRPLKNIYHIN